VGSTVHSQDEQLPRRRPWMCPLGDIAVRLAVLPREQCSRHHRQQDTHHAARGGQPYSRIESDCPQRKRNERNRPSEEDRRRDRTMQSDREKQTAANTEQCKQTERSRDREPLRPNHAKGGPCREGGAVNVIVGGAWRIRK
jgi:hypothetical protein